ncbi:hypothetical protein ACS0PU_005188 [Formica fusca]
MMLPQGISQRPLSGDILIIEQKLITVTPTAAARPNEGGEDFAVGHSWEYIAIRPLSSRNLYEVFGSCSYQTIRPLFRQFSSFPFPPLEEYANARIRVIASRETPRDISLVIRAKISRDNSRLIFIARPLFSPAYEPVNLTRPAREFIFITEEEGGKQIPELCRIPKRIGSVAIQKKRKGIIIRAHDGVLSPLSLSLSSAVGTLSWKRISAIPVRHEREE